MAEFRYFRGPIEPGGNDLEYIEFRDDWPSRQVDIVGGQYYTSLDLVVPGVGGGLADQPLSVLALPSDWEVSSEEFERVWEEALKRRR